MNDIVFQGSGGQPLTNSVLVAEKFDKLHRNIIQTLRKLTAENSAVRTMFVETTYLNEKQQEQPMFVMNRDGFTLLAMGFTGKKALQFKLDYIEAFNKMEQIVRQPQVLSSPIDATILKQLVETTQVMAAQISQMQVELNKQRTLLSEPKQIIPVQPLSVGFNTKEKRISPRQIPYFTVKKMAIELGVTSKQLNAVLELEDIQRWNFPKQRWELNPVYRGYDLTYTVVYEPVDPDDEPREYMVWSSNGRKFIYDVLSERRRQQQQY